AVIAATSTPANVVAKTATTTIPIVFTTSSDPIQLGLVPSLNRPGGNVTGVTQMNVEAGPKRLDLLHPLVPPPKIVGLLVNPDNPSAEMLIRETQEVASSLSLVLHIFRANTDDEIDAAFAAFRRDGVSALAIGTDAFFNSRAEKLATLALRQSLP